jgi:D-amino peptidase
MDMKIYIHTDFEGISGVNSEEMIEKGSINFKSSVQLLMDDINAAVDGAFAGGATIVTVLDSHGGGHNFDVSLLDPRAEADPRENNEWWGKLDNSYSGTFFIGAHAMAGTMNAFLDHTQSSTSWYNYCANGRRMGELGQWAMVAANFNVPMLMVSGDEAACVEARQFFNPVECAVVKRGIGRRDAELVDHEEAVKRIYDAARKAITLVGKGRIFNPALPMEAKLEFFRSDFCDEIACKPGIERLDARTARKVCNNYLDCLF